MTAEAISRWAGREWLPAARLLQRRGLTFSEIAEQLDVHRKAVVQALYWDVVNRSETK